MSQYLAAMLSGRGVFNFSIYIRIFIKDIYAYKCNYAYAYFLILLIIRIFYYIFLYLVDAVQNNFGLLIPNYPAVICLDISGALIAIGSKVKDI